MQTVTIKDVEQMTSVKGRNYLLVKLADGTKASCWEESLFQTLLANNGKTVQADIETNDKGYHNIKSLTASSPEQKFNASMIPQDAKSNAIDAAVALKAAVDFVVKDGGNPLFDGETVLARADTFLDWLKSKR